MQRIQNIMRREAQRVASTVASSCMGIISSYDPNTYSAKVFIQPEGQETGFIPIATPWVGNGWGMFCPPTAGDVVDVHFQEGGKSAPYISLRFYGNVAQPLNVPSGEFWLVHMSGSFIKLHNDGTIEINATGAVNATATEFNLTGNVNVTGNIVATGDISDLSDGSGTLNHIRTVYDSHEHPAPGGTTGVPNQQL